MPRGRRAVGDLAVIGVLLGVCYWLVWPVGEYANVNDWVFNKSLLRWHERRELWIPHFVPMSLVGHVLWGGLFTKLFGFSFTVTKLSVVVLAAVELFVLARWLRWCAVGEAVLWLTVLALLFHPLHFYQCFTFETDLPAMTWQLLGLWLMARGLAAESPRCGCLVIGSVFLGWSTWTRQHGVVAQLGVATYLVLWDRRRLWQRVGTCALGPGAALTIGFAIWYQFIHGPTDVFQISLQQTRDFATNPPWSSLPEMGVTYAVYLGSFVMPLAVALPLAAWRNLGQRTVVLGLGMLWLLSNVILYLYFERNTLFPYLRMAITPFGLFYPNTYLLGSGEVRWGQATAWIITGLSVLGFIALLQRLADWSHWTGTNRGVAEEVRLQAPNSQEFGDGPMSARRVTIRLCSVWLAWQLVYIVATTPVLYDRHLLILAPSSVLLLGMLMPQPTVWGLTRFATVIASLGYYSLAGSHDVHAESRLAFQAGQELISHGVKPEKINGGYAFDGWHLYESYPGMVPVRPLPVWWRSQIWDHLRGIQDSSDLYANAPELSWWFGPIRPLGEVDYVISVSLPRNIGGPPKFLEVRRSSFVSGWSGRTEHIFVLKRIREGSPTTAPRLPRVP